MLACNVFSLLEHVIVGYITNMSDTVIPGTSERYLATRKNGVGLTLVNWLIIFLVESFSARLCDGRRAVRCLYVICFYCVFFCKWRKNNVEMMLSYERLFNGNMQAYLMHTCTYFFRLTHIGRKWGERRLTYSSNWTQQNIVFLCFLC